MAFVGSPRELERFLDREKGSVNVVMPVDQKQLHLVNVTEQRPFPIFMLMILIMILIL